MAQKFKKGVDPRRNTEGRPKGKGNKTTEQLRQLLQAFIEGKIDELETIWQDLEPWQKLQFIDRLLKHVLPAPLHSIDQFSEEDLDILIERLKERYVKN